VNCAVNPAAIVEAAGVTAIEVSVFTGAVTVRLAVPLTPPRVAVIVVVPAATAVARPAALMVATVALELAHVAVLVTTAVEPSL
jgi:hypothetical protein